MMYQEGGPAPREEDHIGLLHQEGGHEKTSPRGGPKTFSIKRGGAWIRVKSASHIYKKCAKGRVVQNRLLGCANASYYFVFTSIVQNVHVLVFWYKVHIWVPGTESIDIPGFLLQEANTCGLSSFLEKWTIPASILLAWKHPLLAPSLSQLPASAGS
jgi:hypothetical protein